MACYQNFGRQPSGRGIISQFIVNLGLKPCFTSFSRQFVCNYSLQSAKIKLARKDGEGAMEDLRLQFRLAEALAGDDPTGILPGLVSVALGTYVIDVAEEESTWTVERRTTTRD